MEIKYYIGTNEVSMAEFEGAELQAKKDGRIITGRGEEDSYPIYTLQNGTVIRGDKKGEFNRMENGQVMEPWLLGSMNEWVQGETTDQGKGIFFVKA